MKKLLVLIIAGLLLLAACAPAEVVVDERMCQALTELMSASRALSSLDATSTMDDLNRVRQEFAEKLQSVRWAAVDLRRVDEALTRAYDALGRALDNIPGSQTVAQGLEAVTGELTDLQNAFDAFYTSRCTAAPAS